MIVFYMATFMWAVGINQTLVLFLYPPAPVGYGFSNLAAGLFYIAPMSAVIVGELFGHFFSTPSPTLLHLLSIYSRITPFHRFVLS